MSMAVQPKRVILDVTSDDYKLHGSCSLTHSHRVTVESRMPWMSSSLPKPEDVADCLRFTTLCFSSPRSARSSTLCASRAYGVVFVALVTAGARQTSA